MGKAGGFLEIARQENAYRPVHERLKDNEAVELAWKWSDVQLQSSRCINCGTPFCHACGCPLYNVIPEINDMVYRNHIREALNLLLSIHNFPDFTGYICPAICEASCVLNINDKPVSIRQIEKALVEEGFRSGIIIPQPPPRRINCKVAVIGSGPAGLTVADILNKAGCEVHIYEKKQYPGGILTYGIPNFKLPKSIVERRIQLMQQESIIFNLDVTIGSDITLNYLKKRFDAICIAIGAEQPRDINIPGRDLEGIYYAMDFLSNQNRELLGEHNCSIEDIKATGKDVVILGGGDTGADCLGTALRQNARSVVQLEIMPEPPSERSDSTPWPSFPYIKRKSTSHEEGGHCRWGVQTLEFIGKNGKIRALRCIEVNWQSDSKGNLSPVPKAGTEFELPADMVILALGFVGVKPTNLINEFNIIVDTRNRIIVDKRHMTNIDGIFSCGDSVHGQSIVVRAIADGRYTAYEILKYLREKKG